MGTLDSTGLPPMRQVTHEDFPPSVHEFIRACGIPADRITPFETMGMARILFISMHNTVYEDVEDYEIKEYCYPQDIENTFEFLICNEISTGDYTKFHNLLRESIKSRTRLYDIFDMEMILFGMAYMWLQGKKLPICDQEQIKLRIQYFRDLNWTKPFVPEFGDD